MQTQSKLNESKKEIQRKALATSFLIPLAIVLISYAVRAVAPFGEGSICSMDGFSQYFPMLQNMDSALKKGEPFYSFSGALGFNLWSQSAYYTNSPLWLFVYILPSEYQLCGINLLVALKIAFSSVFFCLFLFTQNLSERKSHIRNLCPAFGCVWGLSTYTLAYINQLMWLDVIMLLPLVIMGLEKLIRDKKSSLYTVMLFLCMWSCFYLAYMVCIFLCFYFLYLCLSEKTALKDIIKNFLRFTVASLTAASMAAVVLIPVYKSLSHTLASGAEFTSLELSVNPLQLLRQFLPFCKISLEYGPPNLYCTATAFILMLFFFFQKKISLRKRICALTFIFFMCISLCINIGDYIWHGFHFPNQLPSRQSFLLIFLVLIFAFQGVIYSSLRVKHKQIISLIMVFACCLNAFIILLNQTWISKASSLQRFDPVMKGFTMLDDSEFMRLEFSDERKNNGPQQYSFNGVSYYSSLMSADAYRFFENIGLERYAKNVSVYYKSDPILDNIFGIRYLIEKDRKTIRENKNALPLAFVSDKAILKYKPSDYVDSGLCKESFWTSLTGENKISLNEDSLKLKKGGLSISKFDTDYIEGTVNVLNDGVLFTTIPYDEGWSFYIDGKKADIIKCAEYLCCCEITQGKHEVIFSYTVPGIKEGTVISLCGLTLFIIMICTENHLTKTKKKEENI